MKKLIAISITLALVASAAFAQVTVSGRVLSVWKPFFIEKESGDVMNTLSWTGRIQLDAKTEGDIFGGSLRATPTNLAGQSPNNYTEGGVAYDWAYVWWQPIQQVKFQLGRMADGWYAVNAVEGWDFHREATEVVAYKPYYNGAAFYEGFGTGAAFIITPLDALQLVFGIPTGAVGEQPWNTGVSNAMETWKHFLLQAQYTLDNIGIISLTYTSGKQDIKSTDQKYNTVVGADTDASTIYASFQLKMIENLALHFGVSYSFPAEQGDATYYSPVNLGLAADYGLGDFGVKARLAFSFLGTYDSGASSDNKYPTPFKFDLEVMPYYDLGILKAYLSIGMQLTTDTENNKGTNVADSNVEFWVNPYVTKNVGGATFYGGFQFAGKPEADPSSTGSQSFKEKFTWAIPVGINFYF